jgi:hypothetical protein
MGLPPRSANPSSTPQPFKYDEAIAFPGSSSAPTPKQPEASFPFPERTQRSAAAMGNQAVQGTTESRLATFPAPQMEFTGSMPVREDGEALVQNLSEKARRQMRLRELLKPGFFALTHKVEPDGKIRIWSVAIVDRRQQTEEVTDRFAPQMDEQGVMRPAQIIHRQPVAKNDDTYSIEDNIYTVKSVQRSDVSGNPVHIEKDAPIYLWLESTGGHPSYVTLDEFIPPDGILNAYWDLRPPIPSAEPSAVSPEAPTPPLQPTA